MSFVALPSATFSSASSAFSLMTWSLGAFSFSIRMESAMACCTFRMDSASASAAMILACLAASARSRVDCFSPSAISTLLAFSPSACRMDSRRSRSAFICFSMAFWISRGGRMFFSSTRLTLMPQGSVASSRMERILALMVSRLVRDWSSSSSPMMLRRVVAVRFSMALMGYSTP